jgi:two-component system chemotaxis sensor kinase CheA
MSGNHRAAYREEAQELLAGLEQALLELERNPGAEDLVAQIFRTMHTIKGSGAMFGFEDIAGFTHHVETTFDKVRQGKLPVSSSLINLTLAARDHIQRLLEPDGKADTEAAAKILAGFNLLGGGVPEQPAEEVHLPAPESADEVTFRIRFRPPASLFLTGTNPVLLLRELRELGKCTVVAHAEGIPALEDLDFEQCYTWWDIDLTTSGREDAIRDVFIFVEADSELLIERIAPDEHSEANPGISEPVVESRRSPSGESSTSSSIRVPAGRLDSLVNVVGELVTVQARLTQLAVSRGDPEVAFVAEELERLTGRLRDNTMSIRMLPIGATFDRFRRVVRDLARELRKEIEFVTEGGETEIDKTVIEHLNDPLVHMIRNSAGHGIESASQRLASGKSSKGTIRLAAVHSGAHVLIRIEDDGAGLDAERIRAKAIERGIIVPSAELTESETFALIMKPGFSTASEVTSVSGRGVGMDVVQRSLEGLRGSLEIASVKGRGTTITLKLPLTLAIIDGLLVTIGPSYFVLPVASVLECFELPRKQMRTANGGRFAAVRGEMVPYIDLREYMSILEGEPEQSQVMVAETQCGKFGFVVDKVIGDHQTVIKPLGGLYKNIDTFSGATILGDGTVALILDLERLARSCVDRDRGRSAHLHAA